MKPMHCEQCLKNLDPLLDAELDEASKRAVRLHLDDCQSCATAHERKKTLRTRLHDLPVDPPEDGFFDAVIEATIINKHRNESRFWATAGIGGAVAAGLVAWLVLVLPADLPQAPEQTLETVSISLNVEKTLRLSFQSERELAAAAISIELPDGVEVVGYEGRDSVRWTTTVQAGTNILRLPLVARSGDGGPVLARVQHEGKEQTFEFAVAVM